MPAPDQPSPTHPTRHTRRGILVCAIYLALLALSHAFQLANRPANALPLSAVDVPITNNQGPIPNTTQHITYRHWKPERADSSADEPILLIHGSPGDAANFDRLGTRLAAAGYEVYAPDLPGFGGSTKRLPAYSMRAHAHAIRELLDTLGIQRVHIAGWSQGGGVALRLADLQPDRTASLTLIASIGVQETEGSGSYVFEHIKYATGYLGLVLGGEAIPHFGILGSHAFRRSFIRNFWDSDQRPLRQIMANLHTPTLILHGRNDFLTPLVAATTTHELIRPSRLVILDASHFLPILQADQVATEMGAFLDQRANHTPIQHTTIQRAPPDTSPSAALSRAASRSLRAIPWWVLLLACSIFAFTRPELAAGLLGFAVAMVWIDAGIASAGLFAGMLSRAGWNHRRARHGTPNTRLEPPALHSWKLEATRGRFGMMLRAQLQPWRRDQAATAMGQARSLGIPGALGIVGGAALWTAVTLIAAMLGAALSKQIPLPQIGGELPTMLASATLAILAARLAVFALTWTGRRRLLAALGRARRREFWHPALFYLPVAISLIPTVIKSRGLLTFTCANPVIGAGGGVVGESKHEIQSNLKDAGPSVMPTVLLQPGDPETRLETLNDAITNGDIPDAFPLVLKPDAGQRGYAVRIVNNEKQARDYLARMTRPIIAQQYHPGPIELGVLWVRDTNKTDTKPSRTGHIFSITAKQFPTITADGTHTIEQLIYRHPRYRMQADMLLESLAGRRLDVPPKGQTVPLGSIGNHAMGAIFRDAPELITPQLETWIDNAATAFRADPPQGTHLPDQDNGLDFGRFDIRAQSEEDLAAARNLGIIELNGTTAESTNIYDPDRSIWWAWRVLARQWKLLYKLGRRRRDQGARPMRLHELRSAWRDFSDDRPEITTTQ